VSDLGGMAELVKEGGGRVFRVGDPEELARVMRELVEDPGQLKSLCQSIPKVKSIEENTEELLGWYRRLG